MDFVFDWWSSDSGFWARECLVIHCLLISENYQDSESSEVSPPFPPFYFNSKKSFYYIIALLLLAFTLLASYIITWLHLYMPRAFLLSRASSFCWPRSFYFYLLCLPRASFYFSLSATSIFYFSLSATSICLFVSLFYFHKLTSLLYGFAAAGKSHRAYLVDEFQKDVWRCMAVFWGYKNIVLESDNCSIISFVEIFCNTPYCFYSLSPSGPNPWFGYLWDSCILSPYF